MVATNETPVVNAEIAAKVLGVVDQGLCHGLGRPEPGFMCVEAAVCFAYGLPHSDNPPCVGTAVRLSKITLNDAPYWSDRMARGAGMRRVAIAQLGSSALDRVEFAQRLAIETIRKVVPAAMRWVADLPGNEAERGMLLELARECEANPSRKSVNEANRKSYFANAFGSSSGQAATSYAAAALSDYPLVPATASADCVRAAIAHARFTGRKGDDLPEVRNKVLSDYAEIIVGVLRDMGSPGCEFLYLTEGK